MIAALFPAKRTPEGEDISLADQLAESADRPSAVTLQIRPQPQSASLVDLLRRKHFEESRTAAGVDAFGRAKIAPWGGFGGRNGSDLGGFDTFGFNRRFDQPSGRVKEAIAFSGSPSVQVEPTLKIRILPVGRARLTQPRFEDFVGLKPSPPIEMPSLHAPERSREQRPVATMPRAPSPPNASTSRLSGRPAPGPSGNKAIQQSQPVLPATLPLPSYAIRGRDGRIYLNRLPSRSDANRWYQFGKGEAWNIEIHNVKTAIDTRPEHLGTFMEEVRALPAGRSKLIKVHDVVHSSLSEFGALGDHSWQVAGRLTKSRDGKTYMFDGHLDQYKPDGYNFDQKPWLSSASAPLRNILTIVGTPSRRNIPARPFDLNIFGRVRKKSSGAVPPEPPAINFSVPY